MTDLMLEIEEAMRKERIDKLFKEWMPYILTVFGVVVLATAILSGYRAWDNSVKQKDTANLMALIDDPAFPANMTPETLHLRPGLKGIALLRAASNDYAQDKQDKALELYGQIEADKSIPPEIRDLAVLMRVRLQTTDQKADVTSLLNSLEPVWKDGKNPWNPYAHLEAAALYAHRAGDVAAARQHLQEIIKTKNLPDSLYARARALDRLYSAQAPDKPSLPKKDTDS